jgi:hypothetical protein
MNVGTQLTKSGALIHLKTLEDVVADYKVRFNYKAGIERSAGHHDPVVDFCREAEDPATCIKRAVDGRRKDGKLFSEGSCIRTKSKEKMTRTLLKKISALDKCRDFEQVYAIVEEAAPWGIGNLTVYNTTARIAAYYSIHPEEFLYVHAGPLKGWKALTGLRNNPHRVSVLSLPKPLRKLPMHRVEDLLCEYNELLHPGMINGKQNNQNAKDPVPKVRKATRRGHQSEQRLHAGRG